ncbi:MAG: stress response translation initiation inhibitor YciH [Proteobacteria bacterium]|nr:stress response translation initiation inhibitor YciH [Pseudomonadota bacterium]
MANSRLVYSTSGSNTCGQCNKPLRKCDCQQPLEHATGHGDGIRIQLQTKGRKGAGVTLIMGLAAPEEELKDLARLLKTHCGAGGTVKAGVIEIQGDKREQIKSFFARRGEAVKISGG